MRDGTESLFEDAQNTQTTPPPEEQSPFFYDTTRYADNCLNKYRRFPDNSRVVAYVVLQSFPDKPSQAIQFPTPTVVAKQPLSPDKISPFVEHTVVPAVSFLSGEMHAYELPNGQLSVRGKKVGAHSWLRSRRSYNFQISNEDSAPVSYTFYACSPKKWNESDYFDMPVKRFLETDEAKAIIAEKGMCRESGSVKLSKPDILERDKIVTRNPDQNKTVGESAVISVRNFHDKYGHICTNEFKALMKAGFEARLATQIKPIKERIDRIQQEMVKPENTLAIVKIMQDTILQLKQEIRKIVEESRLRFEHLHGESYRHTPMKDNPQRINNLGAGMAYVNTKMMIFEGVAKWFELNVPNIDVRTYRDWEKIFDSNVLNYIRCFSVLIRYESYTIKLTQEIDMYLENPEYAKASDMAGLVGILCMMIQNITPLFSQSISIHTQPVAAVAAVPTQATVTQVIQPVLQTPQTVSVDQVPTSTPTKPPVRPRRTLFSDILRERKAQNDSDLVETMECDKKYRKE